MINDPHAVANSPAMGIGDLLNIDDSEEEVIREFESPVEFEDGTELGDHIQKQIDDFMFARKTLQAAINSGHKALEGALDSAFGSHHPRSYEVVGGIMKQISDSTNQLMILNEKMKNLIERKISDGSSDSQSIKNQNNFYITGTTEELALALENMQTADIIETDVIDV